MPRVTLTFESRLSTTPARAWDWITSLRGISAELAPLLRMTAPKSLERLSDTTVVPGQRLFRSWVLLFGFLPVDRSDLTLVALDVGSGFVEVSPMLGMRYWRHERTLAPIAGGTVLTDRLTFEPRFVASFVAWFIATVFRHRHAVLRRAMGVVDGDARTAEPQQAS